MKQLLINLFNQSRRKCLTKVEQLDLMQRLYQLLTNGFTLYESFKFLNLHFKYKGNKTQMELMAKIENGAHCYEIFQYLDYANDIITQIYLAEKFGNLEATLNESIFFLKKQIQVKQSVIKTIQYPVVLIFIFFLILLILNITVIPQFKDLYQTMNIELSSLQLVLSSFISGLPYFILFLSCFILVIFIIFHISYRKMPIIKQIHLMSNLPIIKSYYKILKTYQLSTELAHFYRNGINLQLIVEIFQQPNSNQFHKYLGEIILKQSNQGEKLPNILKQLRCYENDLIKFIEQGEKSGKLDIELTLYSQILVHQFEILAKRHIKFIQPIIFLMLGIFIVSLYLSIMLPMFDMLQSIN
ncbi:type II secretion system F family protein [Staphylococcus epidermidis]|nr:type II secretion system F family protein [Staphylococcus epidermidis]